MQIQCPHCSAKLQLSTPKPGRFKPTCKKCGNPFLIQVSEDDPPRIRVAKIKAAHQSGSSSSPGRSSESATPASVDAASNAQATVADPDATVDAGAHSSAQPSQVASPNSSSKPSQTIAAVDQTIDQTVQSASATGRSASSQSSGGSRVASGTGRGKTQASRGADPHADKPSVVPASNASADSNGSSGGNIVAIPDRLGGYRIVRMLGRGAMGAVYQAKQVSLDRDVALKTIRGRMADNPASLARFTREAYAAAQLTHHNVVQIYDFGEDEGQHYFSMEWVRGGSLSDLVREKGSLDAKLAATYVLQAARGLQFAHRNGMVHRDVKPANLLLSDQGVVKVADLGLVKVPDQMDPEGVEDLSATSGLQSGTQVTMQGTAVGTPAYMAPEQSADASTVDHRADIYSLGCSLFYLLSGKSPYDGTVASEVIQQHLRAPLPDLADINARVPDELCSIVRRSMAKRPDDRYSSLAEMIEDLQSFLGVESLTGFSPTSDQADQWEVISKAYAKTQLPRKVSGTLFVALAGVSILLTLITPFVWLRGALVGPTLFLATCLTAIGMGMTLGDQPLADRLRGWLGTRSWFEKGVGIVALLAVILVAFVSGLWQGLFLGLILGVAAGAAYHFGIAVPCKNAGQASLEDARRFVRDLRLEGADESGLRDFLARYAGKSWQAIYESLFGYDALVAMCDRLHLDNTFSGPTAKTSLRDRACEILSAKIRAKKEAKAQAELAKIEQQSLISQGVDAETAREKGWQMASALIESAQVSVAESGSDEKAIAEAKRKQQKDMLADARSGRYKRKRDRFASVKLALSGYSRMLCGCALLSIFAFAAQGTGLLTDEMIQEASRGEFDLGGLPADAQTDALGGSTSVWSIGIAGLLLCLSAFVSGWRMTPFAIVATLVILFGPAFGVPTVGPLAAWMVAAGAGVVIYLPGIVFGEEKLVD